MSNETDETGSPAEPTTEMPPESRRHLAVWVTPKVIDTPIVSKTGKGGKLPEDQTSDTGGIYKLLS